MRISAIMAMAFALASIAAADPARAAIREATNIPAQPLGAALQAFAQERQLQVVYLSDDVDGLRTAGAAGELTVSEALSRLLQGTGLTYKYLDDKTITVQPAAAAGPSADAPRETPPASAPSPEQRVTEPTDADGVGPPSASGRGDAFGLPEILVRGSTSLNIDVIRSEDATQPYVVFDAEDIQQSSATNLEDFLKSRLPMNQAYRSNSTMEGALSTSQFNLRGLGVAQTLVLVNGRRLATLTSPGGDFTQPDINGIPISSIERIEVLPATASGIYGGGATGGVINIILKNDFVGTDVQASFDNTFRGDAARRQLDASFGMALNGGKTRFHVAASYSDQESLRRRDRNFSARSRALLLANNPNPYEFSPPVGYLPNVATLTQFDLEHYLATGEIRYLQPELVLDSGVPLGASRMHVPQGYAGATAAGDAGAGLVSGAGTYDYGVADDLTAGRANLISAPEVRSVMASAQHRFGENFTLFLDLSDVLNRGRAELVAAPSQVFMPADAPANPFSQDVLVSLPWPGLRSNTSVFESSTRSAELGGILHLPHDWAMQASYGWSRARGTSIGTTPSISNAGRDALQNGEIELLRDVNQSPIDLSAYLMPSPNQFSGPAVTELETASLRIGGSLFQVPAGSVVLTSSIQHRVEQAKDSFDEQLTGAVDEEGEFENLAVYYPHRSQSVFSGYLEAQIPLVSERNAMKGAWLLDLQLSARHDSYSTDGLATSYFLLDSRDGPLPEVGRINNDVSSTDFTVAARYAPTGDLMLRGSVGTGFLAPTMSQITPQLDPDLPYFFADPKRGNAPMFLPVDLRSMGNPDLRPEESRSTSLGVVLTPRFAPHLRVSVDWVRIEKSDEIGTLSAEELLRAEDRSPAFAARIIREPLEAGAPPEFTAGVITGLDLSNINVAQTHLDAIDVQIDYLWQSERWGDFRFAAIGSRQKTLSRQLLPDDPEGNSVGLMNGPLRWRGNVGLTWNKGPWTADWNAQYYDSHKIYSFDQVFYGYEDESIANQGTDTVPSQVFHDLFVRHRFGESTALGGLLKNVDLLLGIKNVFDKSPAIINEFDGGRAGYSFFGDPRLRRFTLTLRKSF